MVHKTRHQILSSRKSDENDQDKDTAKTQLSRKLKTDDSGSQGQNSILKTHLFRQKGSVFFCGGGGSGYLANPLKSALLVSFFFQISTMIRIVTDCARWKSTALCLARDANLHMCTCTLVIAYGRRQMLPLSLKPNLCYEKIVATFNTQHVAATCNSDHRFIPSCLKSSATSGKRA